MEKILLYYIEPFGLCPPNFDNLQPYKQESACIKIGIQKTFNRYFIKNTNSTFNRDSTFIYKLLRDKIVRYV